MIFLRGSGLLKSMTSLVFIDQFGRIVIKPKYKIATSFSEGLASVAIGNYPGKWGYVDKTGKLVIDFRYDVASRLSDHLAAVKVGELWGYPRSVWPDGR